MSMKRIFQATIAILFLPMGLFAQVTSGTITGVVKDIAGGSLQGASVEAIHEPSGTKYSTISNKTGNFYLPGVRVGGPYKVTIRYVGFKEDVTSDVFVQLSDPTVLSVNMTDIKGELKEVVLTATARKGALISKDRKGASTNLSNALINSMPTLNRSITDLVRFTPQLSGPNQGFGTSFGGQDNRAINFTLDGSILADNNIMREINTYNIFLTDKPLTFEVDSIEVRGFSFMSQAVSIVSTHRIKIESAQFDLPFEFQFRKAIKHEFLHLVGLEHCSQTPKCIMVASVPPSNFHYSKDRVCSFCARKIEPCLITKRLFQF